VVQIERMAGRAAAFVTAYRIKNPLFGATSLVPKFPLALEATQKTESWFLVLKMQSIHFVGASVGSQTSN